MVGPSRGQQIDLGNLAFVAVHIGRIGQARARLEEAVNVARDLGSPKLLGDLLSNKAGFDRDWGDLNTAIASYEESNTIYARTGLLSGTYLNNAEMAIAYLRLDQFDRAVELFTPSASMLLADPEFRADAGTLLIWPSVG